MTEWTAQTWRAEIIGQQRQRAGIPALRKSCDKQATFAVLGILCLVGGAAASVAQPSAAAILIAVVGGVAGSRSAFKALGLRRHIHATRVATATVEQWCADAGPVVLTTVLHDGPKLGVDVSFDQRALDLAKAAINPPVPSMGARPLSALAGAAYAGVTAGVSYLKNKPERDRQQALLTAEYIASSRTQLDLMLSAYDTGTELATITALALGSLPPEPGIDLRKPTTE